MSTEGDRIVERESGLHRQLTRRHMTMIAMGGAIGTGLFLGSGMAVGQAGPGVIVSWFHDGLKPQLVKKVHQNAQDRRLFLVRVRSIKALAETCRVLKRLRRLKKVHHFFKIEIF